MKENGKFWNTDPHIRSLQMAIDIIAADHRVSEEVLTQRYHEFKSRYREHVEKLEKRLRQIFSQEKVAFTGDYLFHILPPSLIVTDERIRDLCSFPYLQPDGTLKECGGLSDALSGCPPYSWSAAETQQALDESQAVILIQYQGLKVYDDQRTLQKVLLRIENQLRKNGTEVVMRFSAGPCRMCDDCLRSGECRLHQKDRDPEFALESCGVHVFETCHRVARITGNIDWELHLIQNWAVEHQSSPTFPSVIAILIRL